LDELECEQRESSKRRCVGIFYEVSRVAKSHHRLESWVEYLEHREGSCSWILAAKGTVAADGVADFKWVAKGSNGSYTITAKGKFECSIVSGKPFYTGLNVTCSCPGGECQKVASLKSGKIIVCKHGAAALELVLDEYAADILEREAKRRKPEQKEEEKKQRQAQEVDPVALPPKILAFVKTEKGRSSSCFWKCEFRII
jgi:hypothetical protein